MDLFLKASTSFRKMADEKTARGKPLPKEEVEFVLIGAGENNITIASNSILALRTTEDWHNVNLLRTGNDFSRQMPPYGQVPLLYSVSE